MRAIDLAEQVPTVTTATTGAEAARLIAEYRLSGLVVVDSDGMPLAVVPGSQVLALVLPRYVRDDPELAHLLDDVGSDELCRRLTRATVGELIAAHRLRPNTPASVNPDDTLIEIAAAMVDGHLPLVVVRGPDGIYHGAVTMSRALAAIAAAAGEGSDRLRQRLERDLMDPDGGHG